VVLRFGQQLSGRTVTAVKAKARELRDLYRAAAGAELAEELQTERGRERWAWLMET
jgi:hypothetical protein